MNNSYLNNKFINTKDTSGVGQECIPTEKSYIENILRLNKGKKICIYQFFNNSEKSFEGILEKCGKDHIILSDPTNGYWYMLLMEYIEYIKFDEEINTLDQFYSITK